MAPWVAIGISGLAMTISLIGVMISFASYRASGPRVDISGHQIDIRRDGHWLEISVTNSGRAEIDIDGAWASWLGASVTDTPMRLTGGTTVRLLFRGVFPPQGYTGGPLTVHIGLGNGRTLLKRITLTEVELGQINSARRLRPLVSREDARSSISIETDEI